MECFDEPINANSAVHIEFQNIQKILEYSMMVYRELNRARGVIERIIKYGHLNSRLLSEFRGSDRDSNKGVK